MFRGGNGAPSVCPTGAHMRLTLLLFMDLPLTRGGVYSQKGFLQNEASKADSDDFRLLSSVPQEQPSEEILSLSKSGSVNTLSPSE